MIDVDDMYLRKLEMIESRRNICEACPLYLETGGYYICNPNLYLNLEDLTTVSSVPKAGFKRGCSCLLTDTKLGNPLSKCTVGKW